MKDAGWLENVRQELVNARAGIADRYARLSHGPAGAQSGHQHSSDSTAASETPPAGPSETPPALPDETRQA